MRRTLAILGILAVAGASQAVTLFQADSVALTPGVNVNLKQTGFAGKQVDLHLNGSAMNDANAGAIYFNQNGTPTTLFCVELTQFTGGNNKNKTYVKHNPLGRIGQLVPLIGLADTNIKRAGLQVAIWEMAYDDANGNAIDITDGIFKVTDNSSTGNQIKSWANTYLGMMGVGEVRYGYFRNSDFQDQIGAVPEPMTLGLGALALAAAAARRRRSK